VQFSRTITFVEDIQVWNATSDGFSFVICFASRSGPGFRGNPGFIASWRPILQNRTAVKVIGSPFETFSEAEKACEAMLGHLKEPSGVKGRSYSHASPLRAVARSSDSVKFGIVHPSPGRSHGHAHDEEIGHRSQVKERQTRSKRQLYGREGPPPARGKTLGISMLIFRIARRLTS
jgi:hypothetical protein